MSNALIAWTNYAKAATLNDNSHAANMPAANMASDIGSPAVAWQTQPGALTLATGALFKLVPTTPGKTWRVMGVFRGNFTAAATVNFTLWLNSGTAVWAANVTPVGGQAVAVAPSDMTADFLQVWVGDPTNPDGFINVPLVFAGPAWFPATGPSWQSTHGRDDQTTTVVSRGGQEYVTNYWQRRRYALNMQGIRASEVWPQVDALEQVARGGSNVLFVPDQTSSYLQNQAIFGRLAPTADVAYPYQGADRRSWSATITERL